jgi:hypothetical protein
MDAFKAPSWCVLPDTNVWVAEEMFTSAVGEALIYALAKDGGYVLLPEIIEMEVEHTLMRRAKKAITDMRHGAGLLARLARKSMPIPLPNDTAISGAIANRWKELSSSIKRTKLSEQNLRLALKRVIEKKLPSTENNEQFRDCCIWESTLQVAPSQTIHLISNDSCFYEQRDRKQGIAEELQNELASRNLRLLLYDNVSKFLLCQGHGIKIDYLAKIGDQLIEALRTGAVAGSIHEVWGTVPEITLHHVRGYSTPEPARVAIVFEARAWRTTRYERHGKRGACFVEATGSYDLNTETVSELERSEEALRTVHEHEPEKLHELSWEEDPWH